MLEGRDSLARSFARWLAQWSGSPFWRMVLFSAAAAAARLSTFKKRRAAPWMVHGGARGLALFSVFLFARGEEFRERATNFYTRCLVNN